MTIIIKEGGVIIDSIEYKRVYKRVDAPVTTEPPKPTLDDVKAWARENRRWVAWDANGVCCAFEVRPKSKSLGAWILTNSVMEKSLRAPLWLQKHEWDNLDPGVPWDQSLIAPDGRMLSVDAPKPKRKKRTEWRVGDSVRIDGKCGTLIAYAKTIEGMWRVEFWNSGYKWWQAHTALDPTFPRNARRPKPKAPKLKRGMLCVFWDDDNSDDHYPRWGVFHSTNGKSFYLCDIWRNSPYASWNHCVPYRPEFEGITIGEIKAILAKEATK